MVILSIFAVLSGAKSFDSIELFGKSNYSFLKQVSRLPNGIPLHDTINRVFSQLNHTILFNFHYPYFFLLSDF
ncbi:MAG: transposase family protein [Prevotellaceae bacterium]|nr:transposase family protein [Prevotellaceae bacterium]